MPYKPDGSDVPDNVKQRSSVKRRQFAAVFNSAYEKCTDEAANDDERVA